MDSAGVLKGPGDGESPCNADRGNNSLLSIYRVTKLG